MDLLAAVRVSEEPLGVSRTSGLCPQDVAYRLSERALLTATTAQLFSASAGFPRDFSVVLAVRLQQGECCLTQPPRVIYTQPEVIIGRFNIDSISLLSIFCR